MDDNKLAAFLAMLSEDERQKMQAMLEATPPGKLATPKKNITKGKGKGKKPVKPVIKKIEVEETEEEEVIDEKPRRGRRNPAPAGKQYSSLDNIPKSGARAATSNIKLGKRPNLFVKSAEFNAAKEDAEIDKLLWSKKKPTARERDTRIESTCKICGAVEQVSVLLVGRDEESKQIEHTCIKCSGNRKA